MKKIYEKPEMKAVEVQTEQFIATSLRLGGDIIDKDGDQSFD